MGLVTPDFGLLFWMILSFSIVLFLLKKFAWKPILSALKEREDFIEQALQSAEKAKEEMSKLQASNEKIIKEARNERDRLLVEAREVKATIINDAKEQATVEGNKMIEAAKRAIENEKASALNEIKNSIANLSIEIAEKILKENLSSSVNQQKVMDTYLNEVKLN